MKITFILPGYSTKPIGGFIVVYTYASLFAEAGHDVTVIHVLDLAWKAQPRRNIIAGLRDSGRYYRELILRPRFNWDSVNPLVNMVNVKSLDATCIPDGDAVIATGWQTAEPVRDLPSVKGRKFYFIQGYETWLADSTTVLETWTYPELQKITVARWLRLKAIEMGVPESSVIHVPNAVSDVFRITEPIQGRPPVACMYYSAESIKGGEDGLEALKLVKSHIPDFQAFLFGSDRPESLPRWATFFRNVPHKRLCADVYNKSSVYVCSSHSEGWHLPAAEAMKCGCAVVSTDVSGVREYAEHGKNALLSPVKDPELLAGNIIWLLRHDTLRIALAREGSKIISGYTWRSSVAKFLSCLEDNPHDL